MGLWRHEPDFGELGVARSRGDGHSKCSQLFQEVKSKEKQRHGSIAKVEQDVKEGIFLFLKDQIRASLCWWELTNIQGRN